MSNLAYPATYKVDQVDEYEGLKVPDPYRWLEDDASAERRRWIAAQNAVTEEYVSRLPLRSEILQRLKQLVDYPRYYLLFRRGADFYFKKNEGLQNQLLLCKQRDLESAPEVLVDPNAIAPDGTVRPTTAMLSKNGRYLAYGLADKGGDWEEYLILDLLTRNHLPEVLQWAKWSTIAWRGEGFYYCRYPAPTNPDTVLSARNEIHQIWYHRLGTPQRLDELVHEDRKHPLRFHSITTTDDERFVVLSTFDGGTGSSGNAVSVLDTKVAERGFASVVSSFDDSFRVVANESDRLLFLTNRSAPHWRLVLIDPAAPEECCWEEVIPEGNSRLESVTAVGERLFATYCHDAAHGLYVFDHAGNLIHEIPLPGAGLVNIVPGQRRDLDVLWSFSSFTVPATIYRYDIETRASTVLHQPDAPFNPEDYETKLVFYPARGDLQIPMFIVHRKGLAPNRNTPLLLHGYGGFGASPGPSFDPLLIALLERGVIYAVACVRGGGEYGETWHHAGWRDQKQNAFDDFIAAAEWLQARGYTRAGKCALHGVSNGALLVGAVITQRPDLCKVAIPVGGVMDMLRFQKFTMGWAWTSEYGSSEDPAAVPTLLRYSPLHNIKQGECYPATLVVVSEHDDCVVPAHSFKFVATLQEKNNGPNPQLIRIETRSGHSPVSLRKLLEERAASYAFMLAHLLETAGQGSVAPEGSSDRSEPPTRSGVAAGQLDPATTVGNGME